jgi:dienelactone hydrolase
VNGPQTVAAARRRTILARLFVGLTGTAIAVAGCSAGPGPEAGAAGESGEVSTDAASPSAPPEQGSETASPDEPASTPTATPAPEDPAASADATDEEATDDQATDDQATTEPAPHPVSLAALMQRPLDGGGLRVGAVLRGDAAVTEYAVTYRSEGLRISGVLAVPSGRGPFPALVLNHGYIDPAVYVTGQGLTPERDYLARAGYVVLHTDYRNHAASDPDPRADVQLRLGYTMDTMNAVRALRRAAGALPVDPDRIGMLGRSMGGGVTLNALVVRPNLVDAAVVIASVSSDTVDNYRRWTKVGRPELNRRIVAAYGSPRQSPQFWDGVSPRSHFDRVVAPVLVQHGTADDTCPISWADETVAALRGADADVTYVRYPGEGHAFGAAWSEHMRRSVAFFDRTL